MPSSEHAGIPRTLWLTPEHDQFLTRLMQERRISRSMLVRFAIDKLRADPVLFLPSGVTRSNLNGDTE